MLVELRRARIPSVLGCIAEHYWFVLHLSGGAKERWEVWQDAGAGPVSWGHVHLNLMAYDAGVGNGPGRVEKEWRGDEAERIADVLRDPASYPWCGRYLVWPGPNSNTYVNWVLLKSAVRYELGFTAWGKAFALVKPPWTLHEISERGRGR